MNTFHQVLILPVSEGSAETVRVHGGKRAEAIYTADLTSNDASAFLDIDLDGDSMDKASDQQLARAVIHFSEDRTAIVHFYVRVDGEKVQAKMYLRGIKRDVIKAGNVPIVKRKFVSSAQDPFARCPHCAAQYLKSEDVSTAAHFTGCPLKKQ